jgi:transglutaminase-like putative cysteine protease
MQVLAINSMQKVSKIYAVIKLIATELNLFQWRPKFVILFSIILFPLFAASASAQIKIQVDRTFDLSLAGEMQVTEVETIQNTYSDRFIPGGSERRYQFVISAQDEKQRAQVAESIYKSLKLEVGGQNVNFARTHSNGEYGISYILTRRVNPNSYQKVRITYGHPELGARTGGLLDAYIPAFASDFKFELPNTTYTYLTRLTIPDSAGVENIVSVSPVSKYREGGKDYYFFNQESLRGQFVWVQRGNKQIYKFELKQPLSPTTDRNTGDLNEYKIIIPRDIDEVNVRQKVYFTKISPEPISVEVDSEGNLLGVFRVPADSSTDVEISGYAVVENKTRKDISAAGSKSDYDSEQVAHYFRPAQYWEVDASEITEAATKDVGDEQDVYKIVNKLYESVVDSIDYSQVKRFGINDRQGALATLKGGAAVCMEYSDLYLTLLRNRQVPARAAFGYGYDSRLTADAQEPHQWVQVYLPKYKSWMGVDVTWGEAGPAVIGGDLNHFYTHVTAVDPNSPPVLSRLSWGASGVALQGPNFKVDVLAELPSEEMYDVDELLKRHPSTEESSNFFSAVLINKYITTWQNLVTNPGNIDNQGWLMILVTITAGSLLISITLTATRKLRKLLLRRRKPKHKEKS